MGSDASTLKLENDMRITWTRSERCPFQPREGQSCASIGDKLYMFGGVTSEESKEEGSLNQESNQLIVFDTNARTWEELKTGGQVPEPRSGSTLAAVDKNLYLFGGLSEFRGWLNDFYVFNIETNEWALVTQKEGIPPSARDKLCSSVIGEDIYYFGGFGPDPVDDEEEIMEDDDDDEYIDEEIQEVRHTQNAANFTWFNNIFKYSTGTKSWTKLAPANPRNMPSPRAAHTMCNIENCLYVFGGRDSVGRQNDLWMFDPATSEWKECESVGFKPEARSFHTSVSVGHRLVVCGGRSITNDHFADCHVFDTGTKQWLQPEMFGEFIPPAMGMHSFCVVNEKIILYGGTSNFDPVTNSCTVYHSDCYVISKDDVLSGGALAGQKTEKEDAKKNAPAEEGKENSLPEFLNLKPTN